MPLGRNDACHCGSGKKYKKCCEAKDEAAQHKVLQKQMTEAEKAFATQKEKEEKDVAEGKIPAPSAHKPPTKSAPSHAAQRHTGGFTPKFNMPRKSGGGGA
jgi:hypothetical protein